MKNEENKYNRPQIIRAIRQFDEGAKGDVFDNLSREDLLRRLEQVSEELGGDYSAEELIVAAAEGF